MLIGCIKPNRRDQLKHRCHGVLQTFDAAVGNGHPIAQTGRTQALAGKQAVGHQGAVHAVAVFKQQARLFESTFFTGHVHAHQDLLGRKDG